nr:hypothetical protein [Rhodococcus sp. (in: high G+C Gram-positive bacteria)]
MENENYLAGLQCPNCGQSTELEIAATALFSVTKYGVEQLNLGEIEWTESSYANCSWCGKTGRVSDFRVDQ